MVILRISFDLKFSAASVRPVVFLVVATDGADACTALEAVVVFDLSPACLPLRDASLVEVSSVDGGLYKEVAEPKANKDQGQRRPACVK
jgi:hypothetical protein